MSLKMCRPGTMRHQGLIEICHMQGKFKVSLHHESCLSRAAHTDALKKSQNYFFVDMVKTSNLLLSITREISEGT